MAWTSPRTWSSEVLSSTTLNTHLRDNLLHICSTTGNLTINTNGPHAIGTTVDANVFLKVYGTHNPSAVGVGIDIGTTVNAVANNDAYGLVVRPTLVEAGTGTHTNFVAASIVAPVITAGAGATANAYTLVLSGAASGATNSYILALDGAGHDGKYVLLGDSSDVSHGITDVAPTHVFGYVAKANATAGGCNITGLSEDTQAFSFLGVATNAVTTEAGASRGIICLFSNLKSGTGVTTAGADDNTVVFVNSTNATHIFKGNGDSYEDGTGWTAYDTEDDRALIDAIDFTLDKGLREMRADAAEWMTENEAALERLGIVSFNRDTDSRPYVNKSRLSMLHNGAIRLLGREIVDLRRRLEALGG